MTFAFIFDSVGAGEWLVLLAVLLVVMGPKRLPGTIRKVGNYYAKFRRAAESFKRQLMEMDYEFERTLDNATKDVTDAAKDVADVATDAAKDVESAMASPDPQDPHTEEPMPEVQDTNVEETNGNQSAQES